MAIEAGWRLLRGAPVGRLAERLDAVLLVALIVASAGGLGVVVGGGGPRESLHYVYAVVGVGILPTTSLLTRRMQPRARALGSLIGALVALIVITRLFQTG